MNIFSFNLLLFLFYISFTGSAGPATILSIFVIWDVNPSCDHRQSSIALAAEDPVNTNSDRNKVRIPLPRHVSIFHNFLYNNHM